MKNIIKFVCKMQLLHICSQIHIFSTLRWRVKIFIFCSFGASAEESLERFWQKIINYLKDISYIFHLQQILCYSEHFIQTYR